MKILIGYIFDAFLIAFGMFIFNFWIESIKNKEWLGIIVYFIMWVLAMLTGMSGILHLKGWI